MQSEAFKSYVYYFRWFIIALGIAMIASLTFMAGTRYACQGGLMDGFRCVQPNYIDLVQVCEYNEFTCFSKCTDAVVRDREAFFNTLYSNRTVLR